MRTESSDALNVSGNSSPLSLQREPAAPVAWHYLPPPILKSHTKFATLRQRLTNVENGSARTLERTAQQSQLAQEIDPKGSPSANRTNTPPQPSLQHRTVTGSTRRDPATRTAPLAQLARHTVFCRTDSSSS